MKHEKKRIIKIIDEMMAFFYSIGAHDINIAINDEEGRYVIKFRSDYQGNQEKKFKQLVSALEKCTMQEEMEEYYWELVGDCEIDNELSLIGMMVNEADIEIEDDYVELILYRYK